MIQGERNKMAITIKQREIKNKPNWKFIFLMLFVVAMIGLVSSSNINQETIKIKQNQNISIIQVCSNSTYSNLTSGFINGENTNLITTPLEMTEQSDDTYIYSWSNTSVQGTYYFYGLCDENGEQTTWGISYLITYSGQEFNIEQSYIYIFSIIFLILLAIGIVWFADNKLPGDDVRGTEGSIVQISMLKYLRPVLWVCVWGIILSCVFILSNMTLAFIPNSMIGNLFFKIFQILFWITIFAVPVYFIWIFMRFFQDKEFQRMIDRGVDIGGRL
jgi:hypothetical protein